MAPVPLSVCSQLLPLLLQFTLVTRLDQALPASELRLLLEDQLPPSLGLTLSFWTLSLKLSPWGGLPCWPFLKQYLSRMIC